MLYESIKKVYHQKNYTYDNTYFYIWLFFHINES